MRDRVHFSVADEMAAMREFDGGHRVFFVGGTLYGNSYGPSPAMAQGAGPAYGGVSHTSFIVWLILLGVILPVAILGGLKVGGFSFVFRGR